jgi:16S rRNA G966 N2-methylase RsmD
MSRFPVSWLGNKRQECKYILPDIPDGTRTFIEPFAGSAAVSLELWATHPGGRNVKYVLGDRDPHLCAFLTELRAVGLAPFIEFAKARLTAEAWLAVKAAARGPGAELTPYQWYYLKACAGDRYQSRRPPTKWRSLEPSARQVEGVKLFTEGDVTVHCGDWKATVAPYVDDPTATVYLDPPYFSSFNQAYYSMDRDDQQAHGPGSGPGLATDNTVMYIEIIDFLDRAKCTVILTTNGVAILERLYSRYITKCYTHMYAFSKKMEDGTYKKSMARHIQCVKRAEPQARPRPGPGHGVDALAETLAKTMVRDLGRS